MVTLDQAARIARTLPEAIEGARHGNRTFFVEKKAFT